MSDSPQQTQGWHSPANPGAWRAIAKPSRKRKVKVIPTMPAHLSEQPAQEGGWRLPDRAYTTARPAPILASPESLALGLAETAPRPEDLAPTATPAPRPEDFSPPQQAEDTLADALEDVADDYALDTLEEDEDAFTLSHLAALDKLAQEVGETDAEPVADAATEPAASEAFDYKDMITQLQGGTGDENAASLYTQSTTPAATEEDPAAAARRAIEALQGGDTQSWDNTPAMPPVDPELEALAQQFQERERQIRELRNQRDMGLISQEQLESQLREMMIYDPREQIYWMMGVDTEIWYKYDNTQQQWLVAEPPKPASATRPPTGQMGVPTDTGNLDPQTVRELAGNTLPQVDDSYYQQGTGAHPADTFQMPGQVPQNDPQRTVVGTAAYRDVLPGSEPTVQSLSPVSFDEDDGFTPAEGIESPIAAQAEEEDTFEEEIELAKARQQRQVIGTAVAVVGVLLGLVLLTLAGGVFFFYTQYNNIATQYESNISAFGDFESDFQTVVIEDANGVEIARLRSQEGGDRTTIALDRMSPYMIHAVVSTENERFFIDPGFDLMAIGRAFWDNYRAGTVVSGASTITQQLARNIILRQRSGGFDTEAQRKLHEIIVARELALRYSKERLLEVYLNEVYFGNQKYGVEAASEFYFKHSAAELNLAESALLAGLIAAPAAYDPVTNPQAAFNRLDDVTRLMTEAGGTGCLPIPYQAQAFCVTRETLRGQAAIEIAQVKAVNKYLPETLNAVRHPHFVQFVQEQLQQVYTQEEIFRRGFIVRTTLNTNWQTFSEEALAAHIASIGGSGVNSGTIMVTDPITGAIRVMVGSPDFNNDQIDGQVNLALSWQQPGSAIKPVVYAAALGGVQTDAGPQWMTPATILWDVPTTYPDGTNIVNFDGRFRGPVSMRRALANSYNVPAVKAYAFVGNENFRNTATAMGMRFLPDAQLGFPTGVGATDVRLYDMMEAYGSIANDGTLAPLYAIESITDFQGNPVPWERPQPTRAISTEVSFLLQNVLADNNARSEAFPANNTLNFAQFPWAIAAKTGTSSGPRDLWTMGFTHKNVVGIWLGRPDNREVSSQASGYTATSPLWNRIMTEVLRTAPPTRSFERPTSNNVIAGQVCAITGAQLGDGCPSDGRSEYHIIGQEPPPSTSSFIKTVQVNTWTGLVANDFCPNDIISVRVADINDASAVAWLRGAGRNIATQLGFPNGELRQAPSAACDINTPILQAGINQPAANANVTSATVPIEGSIGQISNFASYDIQVGSGESPSSFQIVDGPYNSLPVGQRLGQWNAENAANGTYTIRLSINNSNGGYAYRDVVINLQKPLPTPTPTPQPQPTAPPIFDGGAGGFPTPTLLPFDSGGGFGSGTTDATPTLDFSG